MKKVWAICLTAALTAGLLAGCGGAKTSDTAGESVSTETPAGEEKKDGDLSVLLLVPGTLGDKSFFDSANAGLALIEENYSASTKVVEMGTDITKYSATLSRAASIYPSRFRKRQRSIRIRSLSYTMRVWISPTELIPIFTA